MRNLAIPIKRSAQAKDLPLPAYQTQGAAAVDLYAAVTEEVTLERFAFALVPCGFSMAIPIGFAAQVRSRSGLAIRHGVIILNSPGTIDSDYRGEIQVILGNFGSKPFTVHRGMRVAQMTIEEVVAVEWQEKEDLDPSMRGEKGFGHTGLR